MKHAFTLIELIIVIIIIGILSFSVSSLFKKDTLVPATNQVLDHIRYTQQLALNQDMFVPTEDFSVYSDPDSKEKDSKQWFKKWWQIQFHNDHEYTVYSDYPSGTPGNFTFDNNPRHAQEGDTIAKDPLVGKYIAGSSSDIPANEVIEMVALFEEYGVTVSLEGCGSNHIMFDHLGRPHCTKTRDDSGLNPYDEIALGEICVELSNGSDSNSIHIEPITGYASVTYHASCQ